MAKTIIQTSMMESVDRRDGESATIILYDDGEKDENDARRDEK